MFIQAGLRGTNVSRINSFKNFNMRSSVKGLLKKTTDYNNILCVNKELGGTIASEPLCFAVSMRKN
jgi:hypothetical protein